MSARLQPEKAGSPTYRQIWRVVDGAVLSALTAHPNYVAPGIRIRDVRNSVVKRVTGAIHGYAEQSAWVRSGFSPADSITDTSEKGSVEERPTKNSPRAERCHANAPAGGVLGSSRFDPDGRS